MRRLSVGVLLGVLLAAPSALALRIAAPPTITEWNQNTFAQLNDTLLQLWNLSNGRTTVDVVTSDPDGSRACSVGEAVLYDTGTDQWCVCVNATTKTWHCVNLT